ncbi:unnamed protein product [Chondrus crispus]|uniref:Pyridoxamine kinase/Phosphomethylpyrimidine kinase domain-containing protein n=1 Tax=Chondrus crispus TaxID=2769 RepID=R7QM09_CHOCR|nr:unnamed protein product [Chondrus crispus]CDF38430.1 unnamed protein product [Chondrus crispus]|eukprot:XP_005718323.1 unnamed protein product [Chondrus crispus]
MFPCALTIAGSDSGGGAGIQADLKTMTALGVYGASVITALTAQNTIGVQAVHVPPTSFVKQQLDSVFIDIEFSVVKTGMLPNAEIIKIAANAVRSYNVSTLIVDPVLVATSGDSLVSGDSTLNALISDLLPLATLVTPNIPEASKLTGRPIHTLTDVRRACVAIHAMGCKNVLIKGGHLGFDTPRQQRLSGDEVDPDVATDILYDGKDWQAFTKPRLDSSSTHGTGCTLASAIAAEVAKGQPLQQAITTAKEYVYQAINSAFRVGNGCGPLNHMHPFLSS